LTSREILPTTVGKPGEGLMGPQTDGVEWVLATLFIAGMVAVVVAAVREIRKFRQGDPGGDEEQGRRH